MAVAVGLAVTLGLALGAMPAAGQVRFEWPDTTVDVAGYPTVYQCLAAANRVTRGLRRRDELAARGDTLPEAWQRDVGPLPATVAATATRCGARFSEPAASLADFKPLMQLYLAAGRDADAAALVTRRLAAIPESAKGAKTLREEVLDTAISIYTWTRPTRLQAVQDLVLRRARTTKSRVERLELYNRMMSAAQVAHDTAWEHRAARWMVAVADSFTTAERESEAYEKLANGNGGDVMVYDALFRLQGMDMGLDSLRRSTAAFAALQRALWAKAAGMRPEALPFPLGEKAPTITADYWFPSDAGHTPRPAAGRVTVVGFFDHAKCLLLIGSLAPKPSDTPCAPNLAQLRRISERFPQIEVVIVSQTAGFFMGASPPSPQEEAEMIRKWIESYGIRHPIIAVSTTPSWKLPDPDRRRINRDAENATRYSFGKRWTSWAYIVDQDGLVVNAMLNREEQQTRFIEVLLARTAARSTGAN